MWKWLVCLLVLVAVPLVRADDAKPWETWSPPEVKEPQPNAFDTYLQAFALKDQIDQKMQVGVWADAARAAQIEPPDPWGEGPPQLPLPDRLSLYTDVFKLVRVALAQDCQIPPPTGPAEIMPYLSDFRSLARLLAMEAEVHRLEGDYLAAANSALDGLAVAQDASTKRILISYLVQVACESISLKSLDETIPKLKADECKTVLARLWQIESKRLPITETLSGEEIFARISFKELIAKQPTAADLAELGDGIDGKTLMGSFNTKGWEAIARTYGDARRVAALPYTRQPRPMPRPDDPLMDIITPVLDRVFFKDAHALTALHLREAELAVRAYLSEKGQLPQDLQALVPNYLPQIPADPFGEGPLRSSMKDGKLIVYSIGPDGVDDGGKATTGKFPEPDSKGDIAVVVGAKP